MPYITNEERARIKEGLTPENAGQLNYRIHLVIAEYLDSKGENYQACNDIMGALEGVKQEFYRRKAAPYEDKRLPKMATLIFTNNETNTRTNL